MHCLHAGCSSKKNPGSTRYDAVEVGSYRYPMKQGQGHSSGNLFGNLGQCVFLQTVGVTVKFADTLG